MCHQIIKLGLCGLEFLLLSAGGHEKYFWEMQKNVREINFMEENKILYKERRGGV